MSFQKQLKTIQANLEKILDGQKAIVSVVGGMEKIAYDTLELSNQKVPVDKGNLLGTSYVETTVENNEVKTSIKYPEKYSIVQHERVDFVHQTGEAKYLEKAVHEKQDSYMNELAKSVQKLLNK